MCLKKVPSPPPWAPMFSPSQTGVRICAMPRTSKLLIQIPGPEYTPFFWAACLPRESQAQKAGWLEA